MNKNWPKLKVLASAEPSRFLFPNFQTNEVKIPRVACWVIITETFVLSHRIYSKYKYTPIRARRIECALQ